jgi:hypothetical protein
MPNGSRKHAMQLLAAYQADLRKVVHDVQAGGQDGLQRLATCLAGWWRRPDDWRLLWWLLTAAEGTVVDRQAIQAVREWRREQYLLLHDLVEATGAADVVALQDTVQLIIHGGGVAAALGNGHAEQTLRRLLATAWQQHKPPPGVTVASAPRSPGGQAARPGFIGRPRHAFV